MGKIQYYCLFYGSNPTCVKLETIRPINQDSYFGVWKILEYMCGEAGDVGHSDNIQPGMQVSGNEFLGVGVSGMAKFLVQHEKQIIERLFKEAKF
jgi:hypothetical protein